MRDTGRLLADCRAAVEVAASLLEEAATVVPLDAGRSLGGDPLALDVVRREPRGVVAVITPWNDPLPAAAGLLAPRSRPATPSSTSRPSAARWSAPRSPRRCSATCPTAS